MPIIHRFICLPLKSAFEDLMLIQTSSFSGVSQLSQPQRNHCVCVYVFIASFRRLWVKGSVMFAGKGNWQNKIALVDLRMKMCEMKAAQR